MTGYLWRGQPGWDPAKVIILPEDIPEPGVQFTKYQNKPHPRERCGACGHRGSAFTLHEHGQGQAPAYSGNHHG